MDRELLRRVAGPGVPVLVAIVVAVLASGATERLSREPDALGLALAVSAALALLGRRRWPLGTLFAVTLLHTTYHVAQYPGGPPNLALYVAMYAAAAAGQRVWPLLVAVAVLVGGGLYRTLVERESLVFILIESSVFVLVTLLGDTVHERRALAAEREQEAQRRVAEERLRIARDLHDVVAHTVAAISVQAGVAADVLDDRPDQARAALASIRAASRDAVAELRATVGLLRGEDDEGAETAPVPGLRELPRLRQAAVLAGLPVTVDMNGTARPLPAAVDVAAYRIIQESLTNVVRHARAARATVSVRYGADAVDIAVADDGGGPAGGPGGHGLIGMRERAAAVGGWLQAGAGPAGGFLVHAHLPTGPGDVSRVPGDGPSSLDRQPSEIRG